MIPKLDLIGLVVRDMKTSLDFYRALGLDIPAAQDTEGHVEVVLPNGLRFAWDTVEVIQSFDGEWTPPAGGHRISLDFLCASVAEVNATYERLVASGYHGQKAPFDAPWGQRYATLHDPDGNNIALFCNLP
jgi:catechol 2,3-dioxygenase-like lactoylglutathione lyase family enzyme